MAWYVWVMIALAVVSYHQYVEPTKTNNLVQPLWGFVSGFLKDKTLFNIFGGASADTSTTCPDTVEQVCADGVTYTNSCYAGLAGKTTVTPGAC